MESVKEIQWFPGHMAKTRKLIATNLKLVDGVIELRDARIPISSSNPEIPRLTSGKPRAILLNKCDLADASKTNDWINRFAKEDIKSLAIDSKNGKNLNKLEPFLKEMCKERLMKNASKGMENKPLKFMIVGVPNVGKSSLINYLAGGKKAKVEDRPGVTRTPQWIKIANGMEIMDMPGVLWPKFEDRHVGINLALTGAIKDEIMDIDSLSLELIKKLRKLYPEDLKSRYKLTDEDLSLELFPLLCKIAGNRNLLIKGGEEDYGRAAIMLIDEFRGGKIGRITLENAGL